MHTSQYAMHTCKQAVTYNHYIRLGVTSNSGYNELTSLGIVMTFKRIRNYRIWSMLTEDKVPLVNIKTVLGVVLHKAPFLIQFQLHTKLRHLLLQ
jgi:hypothetical protein